MPPKCMVRRLRSVRHVHLIGSFRKERMPLSSVGEMKSGMRVRSGTLCFSSFSWNGSSSRLVVSSSRTDEHLGFLF